MEGSFALSFIKSLSSVDGGVKMVENRRFQIPFGKLVLAASDKGSFWSFMR